MEHTTADERKELSTVTSADGTEIGYWTSGDGPPIVLVNGPFGDHTRWDALVPHLEGHLTVHAIDRCGRGASGDHPNWHIEREYEDVAAVVNDVAAVADDPVTVYGHSGGGIYAFGAALQSSSIDRLILYEGWPPMDPDAVRPPDDFVDRLEALLANDDPESVVETLFLEGAGVPDAELDELKQQPSWSHRVDAAHTGPRELRGIYETQFDPAQARQLSMPTLLLVGEESSIFAPEAEDVADAFPNPTITVLEGEGHEADITAPDRVASAIIEFLGLD